MTPWQRELAAEAAGIIAFVLVIFGLMILFTP